jgi:hypothetical protein
VARKPGRPPGDPLARRTVAILVKLTPIEREVLREASEREYGDRSLTEWVRDKALEAAAPRRADQVRK